VLLHAQHGPHRRDIHDRNATVCASIYECQALSVFPIAERHATQTVIARVGRGHENSLAAKKSKRNVKASLGDNVCAGSGQQSICVCVNASPAF
jgi:hypothetical protein